MIMNARASLHTSEFHGSPKVLPSISRIFAVFRIARLWCSLGGWPGFPGKMRFTTLASALESLGVNPPPGVESQLLIAPLSLRHRISLRPSPFLQCSQRFTRIVWSGRDFDGAGN